MIYPISADLDNAIGTLFDEPEVAYGLLGMGDDYPSEPLEPPIRSELGFDQRITAYRKELENFVCLMATESTEYRSAEEAERLRHEATSVLVALRELKQHFPEFIE